MRFSFFAFGLLGGLLCMASFEGKAADGDADRLWKELNIVPMPKEIRLTGQNLPLDPGQVVLVVGSNPSRQSELGAEWINKRLADQGGKPLPIHRSEALPAGGGLRIVIGNREDNPLIARAEAAGDVNVGPGNPGPRGYEVRIAKDGKTIYLAGADPVGVLYACVTLGELMERNTPGEPPVFKAAEVRDWPDIQYLYAPDAEPPSDIIKNPDSPAARKSYLGKMSKMYDTMLRRKMSLVWYKPLAWGDTAFRKMTPYARETARMGIEAGKERGIASLYYHLYPFVGPAEDHPKVDPDLLEQRPKARYGKWIQSWSMDEERRVYAREVAQWIKEVGFTDVGFHDTDTGGYLNPANWNNRGKADRARWGDDYAAATINKFRIFYEELRKANPDLRINLTLYPYSSEIFDPTETVKEGLRNTLHLDAASFEKYRERYSSFWKQLNEAFPKDVAFAIREPWSDKGEPGLKAFFSFIPGRPVFAWYGLAAAEFYCNVPAWIGTLHNGSPDDLVFTQNIYVDKGYVPLLPFAMREYTWNTRAPGAAPFQKRDRARTYDSAAGDNTTKAFSVVLPHLVRNYFGDLLAPDITKAITENCSPYIVFGGRPERNITDETEKRMSLEAARAGAAAEAMDAAWNKLAATGDQAGLGPDVLARVSYLRQVFHSTRLTAGVKEQVYRSQMLSSVNRFDEALASIREGAALLQQGQQTLAGLAADGPKTIDGLPYSAQATLQKTAPILQGLLDQRTAAVNASKNSGGIAARILNLIAADQKLPVVTARTAPAIDGKTDEPEWRKAYPLEAWFVAGPDRLVAEAPTRIRVLSDENNLYIAFNCRSAAGEKIGLKDEDREFVRVYFQLPGKSGGTLSAFSVWANGKLETYDKRLPNPVEFKVTAARDSWQGEMRIPFRSLGLAPGEKPWRIGFVRGYSHSGMRQVSSTVPLGGEIAGGFDAATTSLGRFPVAQWNQEPFQASAKVRIVEPKVVREMTLDDRIATVVEFGIAAEADCVLDHVSLEVEALDSQGKSDSKKEILAKSSLPYTLKPAGTFTVAFQQALDKGSIHLRLKSDQVTCDTTYQFGDHQEATKAEAR